MNTNLHVTPRTQLSITTDISWSGFGILWDQGDLAETHDGRTKPIPRDKKSTDQHVSEYSCLIRATLKKDKISTVVRPKDMNRFNQAYSTLFKASLDGLKKRDKRSKTTPNNTKSERPKADKV